LIDGVRRDFEALAAQLSGDADVDVPTDLFYRLTDAVVLGVDSEDEGVRRSGRDLFNIAVRDLPLMLGAEDEAKSAREAYARGNDLPRLLVGAVAGLRTDLESMAHEFIPKTPIWRLPSWFLQQPTHTQQLGWAAAGSGTRIPLQEWKNRFEERANPLGALPERSERIRLWVNPVAGMLGVKVYASANTPEEPSKGLDRWSVRVLTGSEPAPQPQFVRDGKALVNIGPSVDPLAFHVQFRDPETQEWVDCVFEEKDEEPE
jgi:hypothetical protein